MSTSTVAPNRRAHAVPIQRTLRHHRSEVARWALANGHPIERDALAVVVAVRADPGTGTIDQRWDVDEVEQVMWAAVPMWCAAHHIDSPADVGTTLGTYLRYLSAHRRLAAGSDGILALRRAVADHRPGPERSRARHPASSPAAPVLPIC